MNNATTAEAMRAAVVVGDYKTIIRLTSGQPGMDPIWASAMTAHYGPTGIHKDWLGADGRPTAELLEASPSVGRAMREACERLSYYVDRFERFGS